MENQTQEKTNKPEATFRAGVLSATVWKNERQKDGKSFVTYSVSLDRRYQDRTGTWQSTRNFQANDLPRVALLVGKAYEHIVTGSSGSSTPQEAVIAQ